MDDYINREIAISQLLHCKEERAKRRAFLVADEDEIIKWLNKFPAADVAPVVHGLWLWTERGTEDWERYWACSNCGEYTFWRTNYCSNCGAKMDGDGE